MANASPTPPSAATLARLKAAVGPAGCIEDDAGKAPFLAEQRKLFDARTPLVLRPADTEQVAAIVRICAETGTAIVPQGGNTGLVGGGVPDDSNTAVLVNMGRLNRVRAVDPFNNTLTVESGCVLADIQRIAAENDRFFPLSLAAEGSCQIGGNLSTNAGGTNVLRYGNTRSLVLGLEVVLPSGQIWNGLRGLRKDNTGYDLKQLFIGAEGTLGIITAAVLRLFPQPRETVTAFIALDGPVPAIELLLKLQAATGDAVTAWELMPRYGVDLTLTNIPGNVDPFAVVHPWYVLAECTGGGALKSAVEEALGAALEGGAIRDAVVAESEAQAAALWRIRETMPDSQKPLGPALRHDVAVPISRIADYIESTTRAVKAAYPGVRVLAYGHLGDGNIHFNMHPPVGEDSTTLLRRHEELSGIVHDNAAAMDGTISAEHGLGRLKREAIKRYKSPLELDLMRSIKATLDPQGIMNPGKVL